MSAGPTAASAPSHAALVQGSVGRTLFRTAYPLLAGTFAMNAYNLTDTWYVARLGTRPLAAMGFTFPVVGLLTCVAMGIGAAITTLASHAMGRRAHDQASRFVTQGLAAMAAVTAVLGLAGWALMDPLFRRLGADAQTLPLVTAYMRIWFAGALFMAMPMFGNGILIAAGDSKTASGFMLLGPLLNLLLDPILIYGWLGLPAMGIAGAALATVVAQAAATAWLIRLLAHKHRILAWRPGWWRGMTGTFFRIGRFAVPIVLGHILMPVSASVITRILSQFGHAAVAAAAAAQRIEHFAFIIPMALGISLTPYMSQNFGAGRIDRVRQGFRLASRFALLFGAGTTLLFVGAAPGIARLFTRDPAVMPIVIAYFRIVAFGYGMMEVHRYVGFVLTGLHKPASATTLAALRVLLLLIPLSALGARWWGTTGVFAGRLAADLFSGAIGMYWIARLLAPDAVTRRWTHRLPVGPPGRTATPEQTADTRASAA